MKNFPKQCVLLGGGSSLSEGLSKDLWNKLKNHFVIGINYSYLFYPNPTIQCFADAPFYREESKKKKFKNLPLIIGKEHPKLKVLPNTITLKTNDAKYYRDVKLGIWKSNLCGCLALSLGIYLLDEGTLCLLGFDYGGIGKFKDGKALTHFYQGEIEHRGIGKVSYFNTIDRADRDFRVYKDEKKVKIYNVSLQSKINVFPKISYDEFFKLLDNQEYDQNILRRFIREKLQ